MEIWKCNVSFFLSPEEHRGHRRCPLPIRSQSAFEEVTSAGGNTQVGQVHISEHHTVVKNPTAGHLVLSLTLEDTFLVGPRVREKSGIQSELVSG